MLYFLQPPIPKAKELEQQGTSMQYCATSPVLAGNEKQISCPHNLLPPKPQASMPKAQKLLSASNF